jgi:hypothetical protein
MLAARRKVASPVDRAMFGYFASKRIVGASGLPWTTLRATQFHEMILMVAQQITNLSPGRGVGHRSWEGFLRSG